MATFTTANSASHFTAGNSEGQIMTSNGWFLNGSSTLRLVRQQIKEVSCAAAGRTGQERYNFLDLDLGNSLFLSVIVNF